MEQFCLSAWRGLFLDRNIIDRTGIGGGGRFRLALVDRDRLRREAYGELSN
jgi:hypothetical protein